MKKWIFILGVLWVAKTCSGAWMSDSDCLTELNSLDSCQQQQSKLACHGQYAKHCTIIYPTECL